MPGIITCLPGDAYTPHHCLFNHTLKFDGHGDWLGEKDSNPHAQIQNLMSYP